MPLVILIPHSPEIKPEHIKVALNPAPQTALQFSPGYSWLIRTSDSPKEIKEKILKAYPQFNFSIFTAPSPDWQTTIQDESLVEWVRAGLDDYPKAESISL